MGGVTEAWIAGEGGEAEVTAVFLKGFQIGQAGIIIGTVLCVVLAMDRLNLPILVAGGLMVSLGFILMAIMPEEGFHPASRAEVRS
jgi:MFS transporter, DHA3 family, tetracycline resistance protein